MVPNTSLFCLNAISYIEGLVRFNPLSAFVLIPQNGQTHSSKSSAKADEFLNVFDHFVWLALKGFHINTIQIHLLKY